jgi:hypothetical protein
LELYDTISAGEVWDRLHKDSAAHERASEAAWQLHQITPHWCFSADFAVLHVLENPATYHRHETTGLPHCEGGPAIETRAGKKHWFLEGLLVDEQLVLRPKEQTIDAILGERNTDIRALRAVRYGWGRLLHAVGATLIDRRSNAIDGTLEALYDVQEATELHRILRERVGQKILHNYLVCTCPTGRIFAMPVPKASRTCEAAQSWLAGGLPIRTIART